MSTTSTIIRWNEDRSLCLKQIPHHPQGWACAWCKQKPDVLYTYKWVPEATTPSRQGTFVCSFECHKLVREDMKAKGTRSKALSDVFPKTKSIVTSRS